MIDFARISIIAGNGGNGAGSFEHIRGKRRGKADGGDGGRGGDVYLEAAADLNTLEPFRYVKEYRGKNGVSGLSRRRKGADGEDLIVKVPSGTVVQIRKLGTLGASENSENQNTQRTQEIGKPDTLTHRFTDSQRNRLTESSEYSGKHDLVDKSQRVLVARGGQGGRGNRHLKDEFGRRPKAGEKGEEGEKVDLVLELKLIADVGLIGLPNAGKSTLLAALTSARPKVADYPFTTLEPNLGVISASRYQRLASRGTESLNANSLNAKRSIVIADIPGLIEGASEGKGLGDLFLRHIERTKILVHLIDVSSDTDKWQDYQTIRAELKSYSKDLAKKREIIVLTKIDLVSKELVDEVLKLFKAKKKKIVAISAVSGEGLDSLLSAIIRASGLKQH